MLNPRLRKKKFWPLSDSMVLLFPTGIWKVLDVANKRSFTVSDDFVFEFVKQEGLSYCIDKREALCWKPGLLVAHCLEPGLLRFLWREFLAADGGLWCLFYCFSHDVERSSCGHFAHTVVFVCSPVLRIVKQLPPLAGWCKRFLRRLPRVVMSTDTVSMEYELIVFNVTDDKFLPNAVRIYESKTASWRSCFVVLAHLNCSSRYSKACPISPVINDKIYSFYLQLDDLTRAGLASYNKATGAVVELGLVILGNIDDYLSSFQLVVIDARLFCIHSEFWYPLL